MRGDIRSSWAWRWSRSAASCRRSPCASVGELTARLLPGLALLRRYDASSLRGDLVAGVVLSAYLIPAGIGGASLAGLPAQAGLYACLFSGLVFWLFCSSRQKVVTVTSALCLLDGAS